MIWIMWAQSSSLRNPVRALVAPSLISFRASSSFQLVGGGLLLWDEGGSESQYSLSDLVELVLDEVDVFLRHSYGHGLYLGRGQVRC